MSILEQVRAARGMVSWFNPVLLSKLLLRVIVADLFGQYADRRLIHAALDSETIDEKFASSSVELKPDRDGAVWVDYVSDLGEGFDSTYAIAYLLAQEELEIGDHKLPRGRALIMGGDQVYPTAKRDEYRHRLMRPYRWAFPDKNGVDHPPVFLLAGNHDWYDGLNTFLAMFCRAKSTALGNWRTRQRRSYFAIKVAPNWWVWGIDIALTADMDQPQADYFVEFAQRMEGGSNLIICSAEPGWYKAEIDANSYRCLDYAAGIARDAKEANGNPKQFKIAAVLSGDTHHYCRYMSDFGTEFVTSGGGGAFLHGTHDLKPTLKPKWLKNQASELKLSTAYPSKRTSRLLLFKDLLFAFYNPAFSIALGVAYWLLAFYFSMRPPTEAIAVLFLILGGAFWGYTGYQEKNAIKTALVSSVHAIVHIAAISALVAASASLSECLLGLQPALSWAWFFTLGGFMLTAGALAAGTIFGMKLFLTSQCLDMNHNDAFSCLRQNSHRHFLRLRIQQNQLTIFPVALDRVPSRKEWRERTANDRSCSVVQPTVPLRPELIESPVVIRMENVKTVTWVATRQTAV